MSQSIVTSRNNGESSEPLDRAGLYLLSLDGGGVRGLSSLYVLKGIMSRLNYERSQHGFEPVKPYEVFDMIGGTSTGGLIAIMLGRLQMDVDECIHEYSELSQTVFSEKLHYLPLNILGRAQSRFDSKKLRAAIEKVVAKYGLSSQTPFNDHDSNRCKVFVCAAAKDLYSIKRLRSYDIPGEDPLPVTITEAALATSAATGYFDPVTIDDRTWIDGALGSNNPVRLVEREASDIWCPETGELQPLVKCFISIGTGNPGKKAVGDDIKKVFDTLKRIATETETTAAEFLSSWRAHYDQRRYYRFNVPHGLQDVGLAEWDRKGVIKEATESYLDDQAQKFLLRDCGKNLATKQFGSKARAEEKSLDVARLLLRSHNQLNTRFVGRTEMLEEIYGLFRQSPNVLEKVSVYGLKGIGKTALAREYARIWKSEYYPDGTVYVFSASDSTVFASKYGSICNPPDVHTAKKWLASRARRHQWLLIVDDVDVESAQEICDYLPPTAKRGEDDTGAGHVLFTTVSEEWALKWLTTKENTLPLGYLDSKETGELFRSISGAEGSNWSTVLDVLPRYPLELCLIGSAVAIDKMPPDQVEQVLQVPATKLSYLRRDPNDIAFFDALIANITENEDARSRHIRFLNILSYLHTTALDIRLLIDCYPEDTRDFELPLYLKVFSIRSNPFRIRKEIRKVKHQLRDILPEPCSAGLLANEIAIYANKSLAQLQRKDGNQMIITIPGILQELLRSKSLDLGLGGKKEFFTLCVMLAKEIALRIDWQHRGTLGDSFASMVSSLMAFSHLATQTWEHFYIAKLNYWAAVHAYTRRQTQQACEHFVWAEEHWSRTYHLKGRQELYWIMDYGEALILEREYDQAEVLFRRVSIRLWFLEGKCSTKTIRAKKRMIYVTQVRGYTKKAEVAYRGMLQDYEASYRAHKITHSDWNSLNIALGKNLVIQRQYHKALELYVTTYEKMMDEYGSLNSCTEAHIYDALLSIAKVKSKLREYRQADKFLTSAIEGTETIATLASIFNLPVNALLEDSTYSWKSEKPERSLRSLYSLRQQLSSSFFRQGRYEEAESITRQIPSEEIHRSKALVLQENTAIYRMHRREFEQAQIEYSSLLEQHRRHTSQGLWSQSSLRARRGLAFAKGMQNMPEAAGEFLSVIGLIREHLGEDSRELFRTYLNFAKVLEHQGDVGGAMEWFGEAAVCRRRVLGLEYPRTPRLISAWWR